MSITTPKRQRLRSKTSNFRPIGFVHLIQDQLICSKVASFGVRRAMRSVRCVCRDILIDIPSKPSLFAIGGHSLLGPYRRMCCTVDSFCFDSAKWVVDSVIPEERQQGFLACTAIVMNGEAYVHSERGLISFDPELKDWRDHGTLGFPQRCIGASLAGMDGVVYLMGGINLDVALDLELDLAKHYEPSTRKCLDLPRLPNARSWAMAVAIGSAIYLIGGMVKGDTDYPLMIRSVIRYSLGRCVWEHFPPLRTPRSKAAVAKVNQCIFLFGGDDGNGHGDVNNWNGLSSVEMMDLASVPLEWTACPPMQYIRDGASAAAIGKSIFVFGGRRDSEEREALCSGEVLDLQAWEWNPMPSLPSGRVYFGLAILCN